MRRLLKLKATILMVAYTNYEFDARVIREAEAALSGGFSVDFIALRTDHEPQRQIIRGVRVIRVNQRRYRGQWHVLYMLSYLEFFLRCFIRISTTFWARRYATIHINNMPDFLVFATVVPKLCGASVVLDIHDPMPNTFASKFKRGEQGLFYRLLLMQERLSAGFSDQVITVHEPVKFGILKKHGLAPSNIEVVANFADDELFTLRPFPRFDGKVRLVYHGTILERSGLRTLIVALSRVRNRGKLSVRLIGEGDFSAELRRLVQKFQLEDTVTLINHSFAHYDIPTMVADCHCGLVPLDISSATNFALPLKLIEYVCMGLPVITVRNAAISYYFGADDCMYFEAGNPDSLRLSLERIADEPEMLLSYRTRVVALRDKFSWEPQKRKYLELLLRLAAPSVPLSHGIHRSEGAISTVSVEH